jgi:Ca2+-binding EF-hand superfamily protein
MSSIHRPNEAINKLRAEIIPSKKLALQQAFVNVDTHGDGYIKFEDYIKAFNMIGVQADKQILKYLFECYGETFISSNQSEVSELDSKVISISYFQSKLFSKEELSEIDKLDIILQKLKQAFIYKNLPFNYLFLDHESQSSSTLP